MQQIAVTRDHIAAAIKIAGALGRSPGRRSHKEYQGHKRSKTAQAGLPGMCQQTGPER
ncbi:MAG: hypothetical protein GX858_04960 [Clostridiales bacterium]|nr:hypothetical protein [Clostridiales bacterium]